MPATPSDQTATARTDVFDPNAPCPDRVAIAAVSRPGTIRQGDRDKAFRPLPEPDRRLAFESGLAAYAEGHFFEAHEILEPAWMGSDILAERALHQGLIKVAAAYVHAERQNPPGIVKNLVGARHHLALAVDVGPAWGVDVSALVGDIDARLADPSIAAAAPPPVIRRLPHP